MVHFPPLPSRAYVFSSGFSGISQRGFPHSEIPGSKLVCSSPRLIAAYRVLHRLLAPRHSPYALSSLTIGSGLTPPGTPEGPPGCINPAFQHPHSRTLLCLWIEKNYRLQDIQLSKIFRRASPPGLPFSLSRGALSPAPFASGPPRGAPGCCRSSGSHFVRVRRVFRA